MFQVVLSNNQNFYISYKNFYNSEKFRILLLLHLIISFFQRLQIQWSTEIKILSQLGRRQKYRYPDRDQDEN